MHQRRASLARVPAPRARKLRSRLETAGGSHRGSTRPVAHPRSWRGSRRCRRTPLAGASGCRPRPPDQRAFPGHPGRRGGPRQLATDGRALRRPAGARGVRDPRLHPRPCRAGRTNSSARGAKRVEAAADARGELRDYSVKETLTQGAAAMAPPPSLDKAYEMLLDAFGFEPATVDVPVAHTHLAASPSPASMLLRLELEGRVAALPGGRYGRIP